jgi:hypothetical protein
MEDSMVYQEYSTFQKGEQLVRMVQRDKTLQVKLQNKDRDTWIHVLNLIGLEPSELNAVKEDLEEIFGKEFDYIWVPTEIFFLNK